MQKREVGSWRKEKTGAGSKSTEDVFKRAFKVWVVVVKWVQAVLLSGCVEERGKRSKNGQE